MKISRIFFYCHNEISLNKERPYCSESQKDTVEQSSEDIQQVGKAWAGNREYKQCHQLEPNAQIHDPVGTFLSRALRCTCSLNWSVLKLSYNNNFSLTGLFVSYQHKILIF